MEAYDSTQQVPKTVFIGWRAGSNPKGGPFGNVHFLKALKVFTASGVTDEEAEKGEFYCTVWQASVCAYKVKIIKFCIIWYL